MVLINILDPYSEGIEINTDDSITVNDGHAVADVVLKDKEGLDGFVT